MRIVSVIAMAIVAWGSVCASEPGQPLDCSDWVFLESGYACTDWCAIGCQPAARSNGPLDTQAFDNESWLYRIRFDPSHSSGACGNLGRLWLYRYNGGPDVPFAYIDDRCNGADKDTVRSLYRYIQFDPISGRLLLWLVSDSDTQEGGEWIVAIEGFTTTFELLQTYEPPASGLSFRVPYMPEGLDAADYFDTYWGDLATVGDWSQAQGLQCGYPTISPQVGDYLSVPDALPTPTPGTGYYYVTAVNYAGERRYGRRASGGVLSGRDPAVLGVCE